MYQTDAFGVEAVYSGTGATVNVVMETEAVDDQGYPLAFDGSDVSIHVPSSDVPGIAQSDTFTISGVVYVVKDVGPDRYGDRLLGLRIQ